MVDTVLAVLFYQLPFPNRHRCRFPHANRVLDNLSILHLGQSARLSTLQSAYSIARLHVHAGPHKFRPLQRLLQHRRVLGGRDGLE